MLKYKILLRGTQIYYYLICRTKLWLFTHGITQEQESDLVSIGKLLEKNFFKKEDKNILIDNKISIDFIKQKDGVILHDIKKSSRMEKANYFQMLYYIWYLKRIKGIENVKGIINYPTEKKIVKIELTDENEKELMNIIKGVKEIIRMDKPPKPIRKSWCKKCSYYWLCWSD